VESESGNTPTRPAAQEERKPSEPGNTGPSEPDGEPAPSGGKTLKGLLEQGNLSESLQTATDAFKSMDTKQFEAFMDDADINVWGSKKDMLQQFTDYVQTLKEKQQPTPANTDWLDAIERNVVEYAEQHPHRSQNFTDLYNEIAKPAGISVQDFKQGMAQLSKDKKISLRPWTGATSSLQDSHGQDATDLLIDMGAENKFFADPISRHQKPARVQPERHSLNHLHEFAKAAFINLYGDG